METGLQSKVEKYESKAAKYKEAAREASNGSRKGMYEVLAGYYEGLATDFRQVADKRATELGLPNTEQSLTEEMVAG